MGYQFQYAAAGSTYGDPIGYCKPKLSVDHDDVGEAQGAVCALVTAADVAAAAAQNLAASRPPPPACTGTCYDDCLAQYGNPYYQYATAGDSSSCVCSFSTGRTLAPVCTVASPPPTPSSPPPPPPKTSSSPPPAVPRPASRSPPPPTAPVVQVGVSPVGSSPSPGSKKSAAGPPSFRCRVAGGTAAAGALVACSWSLLFATAAAVLLGPAAAAAAAA